MLMGFTINKHHWGAPSCIDQGRDFCVTQMYTFVVRLRKSKVMDFFAVSLGVHQVLFLQRKSPVSNMQNLNI